MRDWETLFLESKPVKCKICQGKMKYIGGGKYQCESCRAEELDDFGKVKEYLEEHGPTPIPTIEEDTGVKERVLQALLRKGRLEIPDGSRFYLDCQKCGCSIRYGRYCPECTRELAGGIKVAFNEDMGERPKKIASGTPERMHFLDRRARK